MKMAGDYNSVCLVAYGSEDCKILQSNFYEYYLDTALSLQVYRCLDSQPFVQKYAGQDCVGLLKTYRKLFPSKNFRHHDALEDTLALKRICEKIQEDDHHITDKYIINLLLGNHIHIEDLVICERKLE